MGETEQGWVPVKALEAERDAISIAAADALLALPVRKRVLELMRMAAAATGCERPLRPADLIPVLQSSEGDALLAPETLARLFPGSVLPGG